MIFTSLALAALTALSSTPGRLPGEERLAAKTVPAYACEMSLTQFAEPETLYKTLSSMSGSRPTGPKYGKEGLDVPSQSALTALRTICTGLRSSRIKPTEVAIYNVYKVEIDPMRKVSDPRYTKDELMYSVISFVNESGGQFNIIETEYTSEFADVFEDNVSVVNSGLDKEGVKDLSKLFVQAGASDFSYLKYYGDRVNGQNAGDYDPLADFFGIGEDGLTVGGNHEGESVASCYHDWERWYKLACLERIIMSIVKDSVISANSLGINHGPQHSAMNFIDVDGIINPLYGFMMMYRGFEYEGDINGGMLQANIVNQSIEQAAAMNYKDIVAMNDLVVRN